MVSIFSIGTLEKKGSKITLEIDRAYKKGLKNIESFSHLNIFCITEDDRLTAFKAKLLEFDKETCKMKLFTSDSYHLKKKNCILSLIDIKPYMPSEDSARTKAAGGENIDLEAVCKATGKEYDLSKQGIIRNSNGVCYLQYDDASKMPKSFSEYIHVIWWFNRFDEPKYRRILQCDPPYETDTKTGVFSCRAPVRPNPIATTAVKVIKADYDKLRVYISRIESFDNTPFLGVLDYNAQTDRIEEDIVLPKWAGGWSKEIVIEEEAAGKNDYERTICELDAGIPSFDTKEADIDMLDEYGRERQEKPTHIVVKGARENNLKNISVSIPYGKITAVVGVSGSGKSSLVMDTIYAECQRRMESLNSDSATRQRPEMDSMTGCVPVVKISQKEIRGNINSTIGTFCGINSHLRSIYAAIGERHYTNPNGIQFKLSPATFSFLDPECRCASCNGRGIKMVADINRIISNPEKSLLDGASLFLGKLKDFVNSPNANWMKGQVVALAEADAVDISKPWKELPAHFQEAVLFGDTREVAFSFDNKRNGRKGEIVRKPEGIVSTINRLYVEDDKSAIATKYMTEAVCEVCKGERLALEGRMVTVLGVRFPVAASMSFRQMLLFALFLKESLPKKEYDLVKEHIEAIVNQCTTAKMLGIEYLELKRPTSMISGGEAGRLKLLSAFMNHMTGILYIFDEPSKKLGSKEYTYIIDMMKELVKEGNTVLMVEHNMDLVKASDYVIEIGPKAGQSGGYLVSEGALFDVINHKGALLGRHVINSDIYEKRAKRSAFTDFVQVKHVTANNLHDVSAEFPKGALTCITGVSGSGKSTLMYKGIIPELSKTKDFASIILVESRICGGSARSVVATYAGMMEDIRALFADTKEAKEEGLSDKEFSFNTGSLRCEQCKGDGRIKLFFTQDSYNTCPSCHGKRYSKLVGKYLYQGKTIPEILDMSSAEAEDFFKEANSDVAKRCSFLNRVGLSYIKLGQSTASLSGGEAARLKIATCLMSANMRNTLFLLDEPTSGLHFSDIDNLLEVLEELIEAGNTVVAIEHNKRFLSAADYTITMGPGAGENGGKII